MQRASVSKATRQGWHVNVNETTTTERNNIKRAYGCIEAKTKSSSVRVMRGLEHLEFAADVALRGKLQALKQSLSYSMVG